MRILISTVLAIIVLAALSSFAWAADRESDVLRNMILPSKNDDVMFDNRYLNYGGNYNNKVKSQDGLLNLYIDDESEADSPSIVKPNKPTKKVTVLESKPTGVTSDSSSSSDDMIKTIAYNSREVRLIGPDRKAVEMKDDVGTKMMIALENLGKEATDVWGQINEKLDQGWTELKGMLGKPSFP